MSPFLIKRMVAVNSNPILRNDGTRGTEHGKIKSTADMFVVDKADEIDRVVNEYFN